MVRPCAVAGEAKPKKTQEIGLVLKKDLREAHHEGEAWPGCLGQGAGHPRGPASVLGWKEKHILPSGEGGRTLQAERTAGAKRECERAGVSGGGEKLRDAKAHGVSVCVRARMRVHAFWGPIKGGKDNGRG